MLKKIGIGSVMLFLFLVSGNAEAHEIRRTNTIRIHYQVCIGCGSGVQTQRVRYRSPRRFHRHRRGNTVLWHSHHPRHSRRNVHLHRRLNRR